VGRSQSFARRGLGWGEDALTAHLQFMCAHTPLAPALMIALRAESLS
jgi:hypothetical protein